MTTGSRVAAGSRVVAGAVTLVVAAAVAAVSWRDAGLFTWASAGVPVLAVVPMLVRTGRGGRTGLATAAAVVLVLGWAC